MVMQYNFDNQQKQEKIEQIIKENAQKERLQRQKMFTLVFSIAFVLMLLLAFVIFRNYRRNKKVLQIISLQKSEIEFKNNILQQQSEEILTQNEQLALSKKNITDSIQYASQIQHAMLPGIEIIENLFFDHFVLFNPCHIVSGDFYWFKQIKNYVYIVAADCTGHGVPGAFMSMLGISLLNEIVTKRDVNKPHEILNELRNRIKESLHQTGNKNQTQDGIDIAFCMFDTETQILQFAGAYNPFYLIRNNELIEYKADRMPIGIHPKDKLDFVSTEIQLQQKDKFYIFSDGYVSQFGGSKDEKFKTKRFQELLLKTNNEPMQNQKQFLANELDDWRGNIPQTDDILVIGIHVNGQKSS
jgi:serine phosphatase RsbU (regulator of sigma subunit)